MIEIIPRRIISFAVLTDGNIKELVQSNAPINTTIPLIGDEVRLQQGVFKVIKRRYIYTEFPSGVSEVISLVLSPEL